MKEEDKKVDAELEKQVLEETVVNEEIPATEEPTVDEVLEDEGNQMFIPEGDDTDYESNGLLTGEQYDVPEDVDGFVDSETGEVIKREDMTPWQIIKAIAKQNNVEVDEPSKGCGHCYGRGYEALDAKTKMPVPCRCIFRGRTERDKDVESYYDSTKMQKKFTREQKRKMSKFLRNSFRNKRRNESRRTKAGQPILNPEREIKEPSTREINKVLREYIKKSSLKQTASSLSMTLTAVKKIVKNNRGKIEKLQKKETK